jgi:hypothetical protein
MLHRKPPPICGPPGQFEDSDEDSEDEDPYENLRNEIAKLKMKNNLLEECVAEAELGRMEIDDKMEILRKAICSKFKRLLSELGRPDLYDRVLPYISKHRIRVASR